MDRKHLPAHAPREASSVEPVLDIRDKEGIFPTQKRLSPPEGAPNVLLILLDDMGFGASSAFGGPCPMPNAEALADGGLRYSRFHTTAICAPTRAALLTGRNHHSVGMGGFTETATDAPGYDGIRPRSAGTLAQTLNYNGYATGAFGKWHQTPPWEQTAAGPFDHWPTHEGFDRFYGILDGECNQFAPALTDDTKFVDPPKSEEEGYHFSEDIVDQAREWIRQVRNFDNDKPWFTYLAFGATHAPFHVPASYRGRHRGEFAHGWDEQREITLARQKELGVVPEDAELARWMPGVPHWDELDETGKLTAERLMELYASFAEHTDAQVGRLIDFLREQGELENTLVIYILGDNGASAEGQPAGTLNEGLTQNGFLDTTERIASNLDLLGGPYTFPHYPSGWAVAMNTPYQWTKQIASHYGGSRNGTIVHWPKAIEDRGEIRHQWHHVIDVAPTIFEAIGLPHPETIDGVEQDPIQGTSFYYSLNDAEAPERHLTQYFEIFGNRGIYHEGWTAVTQHRSPLTAANRDLPPFTEDVWELYDTNVDWSQAHDLAAERPEKLAELQELFLVEARKHNVLPLDDRRSGRRRLVPGRPHTDTIKTVVLTAEDGRLHHQVVPDVKNTSFDVVVDLEVSSEASDGVLVAQGGRFGGWALYLKDGVPTYVHNLAGLESFYVRAAESLPTGRHRLGFSFQYDRGGVGKGGQGTLRIDGEEVGSGRVERTVPLMFSINEQLDVGVDRGTPVTEEYSRKGGNPLQGGTIETVTITAGDDAVQPEESRRFAAALSAH